MKPLKPQFYFGNPKEFRFERNFKSQDWDLENVFTKDMRDGKPKFYAHAAVSKTDNQWVWTLPAN